MENLTTLPGFVSSASDGSTFNSADGDSGAQDMFGDSLSLAELRKAYPELYQFMCQTDPTFEDSEISDSKEVFSWSQLGKSLKDQDFEHDFDMSQLLKESNSVNSLMIIRKAMSSIFECLNTVHVQKTLKLRLEIRDLCCRLQNLQTSREIDQHEIYRLQRENDRYQRELTQQASRYEDRITELHGVLEELKRKAAEMQTSATSAASVADATVGVDDLVEVSDNDTDDGQDTEGACANYEYDSRENDDRSDLMSRSKGNQDLWIGGSVHTVCSAQSDTAAGTRHTELTSSAASASGILGDTRTQGKPVMGLRQHNQTRKPRILSQAQLSQASSNGGGNALGGSNWLRMNIIQNNTFSQPNSEFSLNYDGGEQTEKLSKASSTCEDRVRQSHSGALSDGTSSVPQSCHSGGDNNSGDEPEPQWVRHCVNRCLGVNNSNGGGISPNLVITQTLLSGLAGAAPYPRLADIARCALLACEQRDTLCARQEAELTVLEASLAESKATGDQLHCRLGQIESSWGAASRAADLADMALETSGILVHLYSSELALLLHKQPNHDESSSSKSHHHHQRPFGRPGTFSSSTSTSSSSSSCTSSSGDEDEDECVHPRPPRKPPVPAHMVTPNNRNGPMNNGDVGRHAQIPSGTTISDNGSNVYAVYAPNGKPSEEMDSHISMPTWIPPHAVCNGPACLRLLKMQRHQTEVAALQLLARFASTPEPFFKPESLISAAPGEDFEPNGTNGNRSTATCTESGLGVESGGSSSGMGAHGVYANAWCIASRPVVPLRQAFKSGGGWQTPDSGAGSFSTNDHAGNAATVSAVSGVSTTHSSNSSASSVPPNMGVGVNPTTSVVSDGAGWSRVKEMKLRHILDQIIWERMLVRSTIAVGGNDFESANSGVPPNGEFHYMKPYAGSEMLTYGDGGNLTKDSREPVVFSRLNALMMLDTAALLQDLCAVKEDRAKLKVQNYIMEKELRAIQISHQGHCLSESALRNQLNALQIDRNLHMLKNSDRNGTQNPLAQQIENLQSAFESLRKGTEQHQSQSDELVNDLKQANAALITAFEKAKSKYLARIRKLEGNSLSRANSSSAMPPSNIASNAEKHACSAGRPPAVPAHRNSQPPPPLPPLSPAPPSDVYEVIQDTHVGPPNPWQDSPVVSGSGRSEPPMANGCYSLVRTAPFYPKSHSMMMDNRSHARPR